MKLFTSYIRELFARYILKKLNTINTSNGREVKYDFEPPVFSFSRHIRSIVSNACSRCSRSTIQKITKKTTCKSRFTGKCTLNSNVGFLSLAVTRRFLRSAPVTSLSSVETTRGKSLTSYVLYLATIKILFCVCLAHARQSSSPEAAYGVALSTDSIKPLRIGDTIPDALWQMPLQMVKAGQEGSTTVTLNDYKGKLIILDFWATWCGSCIAAMPALFNLQNNYQQDFVLIPVTHEGKEAIAKFMERNGIMNKIEPYTLVNASRMKKIFPHRTVSHLVWINKHGTVNAITDSKYVTRENLLKVLQGKSFDFVPKSDDLSVRKETETFDNTNGLLYQSKISKYHPGRHSVVRYSHDTINNNHSLHLTNTSLLNAFKNLYNLYLPNNQILLSVKDSTPFIPPEAKFERDLWTKETCFSYELTIAGDKEEKALKDIAIETIDRYFNLQSSLVYRLTDCYILQKIGGAHSIKPQVLNSEVLSNTWNLGEMLRNLNKSFGAPPALRETDSKFPDEIRVPKTKDVDALNQVLKKYGWALVQCKQQLPFLLITDQ